MAAPCFLNTELHPRQSRCHICSAVYFLSAGFFLSDISVFSNSLQSVQVSAGWTLTLFSLAVAAAACVVL